jgi:hypothetical protein
MQLGDRIRCIVFCGLRYLSTIFALRNPEVRAILLEVFVLEDLAATIASYDLGNRHDPEYLQCFEKIAS